MGSGLHPRSALRDQPLAGLDELCIVLWIKPALATCKELPFTLLYYWQLFNKMIKQMFRKTSY